MDTIPGLVGLLTASGEVDVLNRQLLEYFGQTQEAPRGCAANGTIHPDDLPHVIEVFSRAIAAGKRLRDVAAPRASGLFRAVVRNSSSSAQTRCSRGTVRPSG